MNRRFILASIATLALASVGHSDSWWPRQPPQKSAAKTAAKSAKSATPAPPAQASITVDGVKDIDPTKAFGSKNAASSWKFSAIFSARLASSSTPPPLQRVMDNYVDTNKVYIVHRDFPLPMHAYSRVAASYSRAAAPHRQMRCGRTGAVPESGKVGDERRREGHRRGGAVRRRK